MAVLVTLDGMVCDPDAPLLYADDLAAVRGDGVFETLLVRDGRACLVESHLRRLAASAHSLQLPEPDLATWRAAIDTATRHWAAGSSDEAALRLVYSRGRESGSAPTAYVSVNPLPARIAAARRDGVSALCLQRGLPSAADEMPWLLAGAKTLSYALNMAALRHAADAGADDVVFVSSDGYILEGPRSTVVIATDSVDGAQGQICLLTPPPWYPILRGTTQQALFEVARAKGYDCDYRALRPADLFAAQGVWLISAITLAARVHTLDGQELAAPSPAADVAGLVDAAIVCDR
ncbi:4-amino-4-deoxychorismate lyase [Mycobacterium sp. djl-10]|jgi:4-amino-4-deoxychorismate lyase|nr:4-amino-4-deoxychorismate lyase [Mycobacterium sp. djl-10]